MFPIPTAAFAPGIQSLRATRACGACALILGFLVASACGNPGRQPTASAYNLQGRPVDPLLQTNGLGTVLVFVAVDCPISNRYAPEVQRMKKRFGGEGFRFWIVYPDRDTSAASIREHTRDFGLGDDILRDPQHVLVKAAHASITPEVAVFVGPGRLVYHGQIDDRFVALGMERPEPTRRYLEETLRALVNHEPVRTPETQAVGCSIAE